jgi:ATP-dependent Clp protease ATP-binding subunit ClpB
VIFGESDPERMRQRVEDVLRGTFRPEFLNRIDETVIFHRLGREELAAVVDLQLERLRRRLAERGLALVVSDDARALIAEEGDDPAFGARPLKRAIQRLIENPLAKLLLEQPPAGDAEVRVEAADGALELRVAPAVALAA